MLPKVPIERNDIARESNASCPKSTSYRLMCRIGFYYHTYQQHKILAANVIRHFRTLFAHFASLPPSWMLSADSTFCRLFVRKGFTYFIQPEIAKKGCSRSFCASKSLCGCAYYSRINTEVASFGLGSLSSGLHVREAI